MVFSPMSHAIMFMLLWPAESSGCGPTPESSGTGNAGSGLNDLLGGFRFGPQRQAIAERHRDSGDDCGGADHFRHRDRGERPESRVDKPAQHHGPATNPLDLTDPGVRGDGLGHPVADPGDHEPIEADHQSRGRLSVDVTQLARVARAERHDEDADGPGEPWDQCFVHRALSFLIPGFGVPAPTPKEWTKPSSASSSTESFRW